MLKSIIAAAALAATGYATLPPANGPTTGCAVYSRATAIQWNLDYPGKSFVAACHSAQD